MLTTESVETMFRPKTLVAALVGTLALAGVGTAEVFGHAATPDLSGYYVKYRSGNDPTPPGGWPPDNQCDTVPGPIGRDGACVAGHAFGGGFGPGPGPGSGAGSGSSPRVGAADVPSGSAAALTAFRMRGLGPVPLLQPWAQARIKWARDAQASGNNFDSVCQPRDLLHVLRGIGTGTEFQILQSPKQVVILYGADSRARIIYLNEKHPKDLHYSYLGHSIGHWAGDTLIVDTIGLKPNPGGGFYRAPTTEAMHVVEHISLFDGGNAIEDIVEVDDPNAFVKPWRSVLTSKRIPTEPQLMEYECAENTFDIGAAAAPKSNK